MGVNNPKEILAITEERAVDKANMSIKTSGLLGILGGVYIALGYLAFIRVVGTMPASLGSFNSFLGACVFPIGLVLVLLAGGELITGNMLVMAVGCFRKKITPLQLAKNWFIITAANLIGALLVAYFFGHTIGLTEGSFLAKTLAVASAKAGDSFWVAFVSGIGCNIFVCLGVWLSFGAKDFTGKILAIWFPVMIFVAIGFQHVAANMFIIPAAIFSGQSALGWIDFAANVVPVFLGNAFGGSIVLGFVYSKVYGI